MSAPELSLAERAKRAATPATRLRGELEGADRDALGPLHEGRVSDLFAVLGYISVRHPGLIAEAVDAMDLTASMARHPAGRHRRGGE